MIRLKRVYDEPSRQDGLRVEQGAELRRKQEFAQPIEIGSDVWVGGGAISARA